MVEFSVLVILAILAFAVIGVVASIRWLLLRTRTDSQTQGSPSQKRPALGPAQASSPTFSLEQDLQASRRLIDHLFATSQIDEPSYVQFRNFLEKKNLAGQQSVDIGLPDSAPRPTTKVPAPLRPKPIEVEQANQQHAILTEQAARAECEHVPFLASQTDAERLALQERFNQPHRLCRREGLRREAGQPVAFDRRLRQPVESRAQIQ